MPTLALPDTPYALTNALRLSPKLGDGTVPTVPDAVRTRVKLPARYAGATLAEAVRHGYEPRYFDVATRYVAAWPEMTAAGKNVLIAGPTGSGTSWTAAAMLNEITLRGQTVRDVTTAFCSAFWMCRVLQDARDLKRTDTYFPLRDSFFKATVVVVDDLLGAKEVDGAVPFLHTLYAHRYDHKLPTITTISSSRPNPRDVLTDVAQVFGRQFTERLTQSAAGFTVHLPIA